MSNAVREGRERRGEVAYEVAAGKRKKYITRQKKKNANINMMLWISQTAGRTVCVNFTQAP